MSASDFTSAAELELVIPDSELRAARERIESGIGETPVGMTDGGSMSAQAAGGSGGGRARRRARREYRWARERTGYLEEAVTYLEEIEDKVGEGGGGGGGGIIDDLIGSVTETAGDAAIEGGSTIADIGTEALGTTIGTSVANAIQGNNLGVEEPEWAPLAVENIETVPVDEPTAVPLVATDAPIAVQDPSPLSVANPSPLGVEDAGPIGFEGLPGPVGFEELPGPIGIEEPQGTYPLEEPDPYPVEDVDTIEVSVDVSADASATATGTTSTQTGTETESSEIRPEDVRSDPPTYTESDPEPAGSLAQSVGETGGIGVASGGAIGGGVGAAAGGIGAVPGAAIGAVGGGALGSAAGGLSWGIDKLQAEGVIGSDTKSPSQLTPENSATAAIRQAGGSGTLNRGSGEESPPAGAGAQARESGTQNRGSGEGSPSAGTGAPTIELDNSSVAEVHIDVGSLREIERAISEVESAHEDNVDDLEREIEDLRSDLDDVRRQLDRIGDGP